MKLTMKLGSLAVVGLFSVSTLAQVAVRPRPTEIRPEAPVQARPTVEGQNLRGRLDGMRTGTPAATAPAARTQPAAAANSCSKDQFASELAADTKVSYANFKAVVDAGMISMGVCGQGVTKYVPNARENLGEGEVCTLNAGGANMPAAQRDQVRTGCYAAAFNNDPGATQVTAASVAPTIAALRNDCKIIQ